MLVVLVTCPAGRAAQRLAARVIAARAAACVNILPGVQSVFRWAGKVDRARESLLVIKTTSKGFSRLRRTILASHPYDVPEILAMPVSQAHQPYLRWVRESVLP